jgi:hypothetical protein
MDQVRVPARAPSRAADRSMRMRALDAEAEASREQAPGARIRSRDDARQSDRALRVRLRVGRQTQTDV